MGSWFPSWNSILNHIYKYYLLNCELSISFQFSAFGYDELSNRVKRLRAATEQSTIDGKNKVAGNKKGAKSVSSKATARPQTGKKFGTTNKKDLSATFGDIPIEVFIELLRDRYCILLFST